MTDIATKRPPCRCGAPAPEAEIDRPFEAAFMECGACCRVVGGLDEADALELWNAAMAPIKD
jgi:hypothetical protein